VDFVFDIDKTVASAAYLTKKNGNQISVFILLKMMYGAERDALAKWRRPITGDSFASMKKGPVLCRTCDLIKGSVANTNSDMIKWSKHFSPQVIDKIKLLADPEFGVLSQLEIEALQESASAIADLIKQHGLIADTLHERWPEWEDPSKYGRGSIPLSLEDVLSEVIEDDAEVERIILEIRAVSSAKAALQVSAV
jgi:uncharacterized phage-associated protein